MAGHSAVLSSVLRKIRPPAPEEKKLKNLAQRTLEITQKEARKFNGKPILAGSITRGTWLMGKKEFDVFIQFPTNLPEKKLEDYGLAIGKEVIKQLKGKFAIEYAQHPYASGTVSGVDIDIVPCYAVESASKIKSAVDRTPFHVRYIDKNLPPSLSDDVRLLKQLLSANRLYGADAKTQGFSGYVCELLIIKHKGFLNLLKSTQKWIPGEIIDIESHYTKEENFGLRKIFKNQTLILIDPTDKNRNTASALSAENFLRFRNLAKQFLSKPDAKLFSPNKLQPITKSEFLKSMKQRNTELILVKFKPPKIVPDIFWPQLRKFGERLHNILEETKYEFKVFRHDVYSNEVSSAIVLLEMEVSRLPPVQKRTGPSVFDVKDAKRFLEKYKKPLVGPYVENNFWIVEVKRKFVEAREKLIDSLKDNEKVLESKGIPNNIAKQIVKEFEVIYDDKKILGLASKDKEFGAFLRHYFFKEL